MCGEPGAHLCGSGPLGDRQIGLALRDVPSDERTSAGTTDGQGGDSFEAPPSELPFVLEPSSGFVRFGTSANPQHFP